MNESRYRVRVYARGLAAVLLVAAALTSSSASADQGRVRIDAWGYAASGNSGFNIARPPVLQGDQGAMPFKMTWTTNRTGSSITGTGMYPFNQDPMFRRVRAQMLAGGASGIAARVTAPQWAGAVLLLPVLAAMLTDIEKITTPDGVNFMSPTLTVAPTVAGVVQTSCNNAGLCNNAANGQPAYCVDSQSRQWRFERHFGAAPAREGWSYWSTMTGWWWPAGTFGGNCTWWIDATPTSPNEATCPAEHTLSVTTGQCVKEGQVISKADALKRFESRVTEANFLPLVQLEYQCKSSCSLSNGADPRDPCFLCGQAPTPFAAGQDPRGNMPQTLGSYCSSPACRAGSTATPWSPEQSVGQAKDAAGNVIEVKERSRVIMTPGESFGAPDEFTVEKESRRYVNGTPQGTTTTTLPTEVSTGSGWPAPGPPPGVDTPPVVDRQPLPDAPPLPDRPPNRPPPVVITNGGTTVTVNIPEQPSLCEEFPSSLACLELGEVPTVGPLPEVDAPTGAPVSIGGTGAGACPQSPSATIAGYTFTIDTGPLCTAAGVFRVIFLLMMSIASAMVIASVRP